MGMLGGKKQKSEKGTTLVANNCQIEGDVLFSDELCIEGVVKGDIIAKEGANAQVRVSDKGCVVGEIRAPSVIVNGKVFGDIHSDKHVELAARAEVKGNVYYNLIEMVMGSRVDGSLVHVEDGKREVRQVERRSVQGAAPAPVQPVKTKSA
jgi:cytoskeletal protein CcmA (bactofilin family)